MHLFMRLYIRTRELLENQAFVLSIIMIFILPFLSTTLHFFSLSLSISLSFSSTLSCSYEPLMLKRPDPRRSTTQTWHFCSGMLTCGLPRLVVQVCLFFGGGMDQPSVLININLLHV